MFRTIPYKKVQNYTFLRFRRHYQTFLLVAIESSELFPICLLKVSTLLASLPDIYFSLVRNIQGCQMQLTWRHVVR
jgi:hypothetical protein